MENIERRPGLTEFCLVVAAQQSQDEVWKTRRADDDSCLS